MTKKELNPALKMSYEQKQERALQKKASVLNFLASGEVWTTLSIVAELLKVTERTAQHLLARLVEERLVAVDLNVVPRSNLKIYGITEHGLSVCESTNPACKAYLIGRTNPAYVTHHIQSQLVRIRMERVGWTGFVPGKLLYGSVDRKGQIVPDFIATRPDGLRIAGEIERYCKSPKRQSDVFAGHLKQIINKKYDYVYYFVPDVSAQLRAFNRVDFITIDSNKIKLNDSHRARFKIFNINEFKGEI